MNTKSHNTRVIEARNPRTGKIDYSFNAANDKEIKVIVADLRKNQRHWSSMTVQERARVLSEWAKVVSSSKELLEALVTDTGRYFIATAEIGRLTTMIQDWLEIGEEVCAEKTSMQTSAPTVTYKHQ